MRLRRQQRLAGVGDGNETRRPGEWRSDRFVLVHLKVAEVHGHSGAVVDQVTRGAHGLDRFGEDCIPSGTLGRQLATAFAVGRGSQLELAMGERGLSLPWIGPPRGIVEVGDDDRPPLDRRRARDEQAAILIEDPALEILQLR